jgi:magnesium transporter
LTRALWPLRDGMAALVRTEAAYVKPETKIYLNDTLDHTLRLIEMIESQRDMLTGLIDMHLSLSQARTNDVISFHYRVGDLHSFDVFGGHLGYEFQPGCLAVEYARTKRLFRLPHGARTHAIGCGCNSHFLQKEEMALSGAHGVPVEAVAGWIGPC